MLTNPIQRTTNDMTFENEHFWLGYLGQALAEVVRSETHEQAVALAASRLAVVIEHSPIEDAATLDGWEELLSIVQEPGLDQKENSE